MRRKSAFDFFFDSIVNEVKKDARKEMAKGRYTFRCSCGHTFRANAGFVKCPKCGTEKYFSNR